MTFSLTRFLGLIGPYPYNPTLIFFVYTYVFISRFFPIVFDQPRGPRGLLAALVVLSLSTIPGAVFAFTVLLFQKYRRWSSTNLFYYLLEVVFTQLLLFACAPIIKGVLFLLYGFDPNEPFSFTIGFFLGSLVLALSILAVSYQAERNVLNKLANADYLVKKLRVDREQIINSEEEFRAQTSRFLHDHLQSDLMVLSLQLKSALDKSDRELSSAINSTITQLESIRSVDLRNVIEILSPNFEAKSFTSTLKNLTKQYAVSTQFEVHVDEETENLDHRQLLGLFRIIEQSLINSFLHGPATRIDISVATNLDGITELVVSDNGPGAQFEKMVPGRGSAVIDSWVDILKASKSVDTVSGHGYRLSVAFSSSAIE